MRQNQAKTDDNAQTSTSSRRHNARRAKTYVIRQIRFETARHNIQREHAEEQSIQNIVISKMKAIMKRVSDYEST